VQDYLITRDNVTYQWTDLNNLTQTLMAKQVREELVWSLGGVYFI